MAEAPVTDTHALLWHLTGARRKLGRRARAAFDRAEEGRSLVLVPVVVLFEVLDAWARGRLRLDGGFAVWTKRLRAHPGYEVVDLTADIVVRSSELLAVPERADRLIAATALERGGRLITRDPQLAGVGVPTMW